MNPEGKFQRDKEEENFLWQAGPDLLREHQAIESIKGVNATIIA
jgi:hypothetical protein